MAAKERLRQLVAGPTWYSSSARSRVLCGKPVGRLLDEHGEGIERLPQFRQRHPRTLQELPEPPHGGALGVLGLVVADQESDAQGVLERERRKVCEFGAHGREVASIEGLLEPRVARALDRHERMFASVSVLRSTQLGPAVVASGHVGDMLQTAQTRK